MTDTLSILAKEKHFSKDACLERRVISSTEEFWRTRIVQSGRIPRSAPQLIYISKMPLGVSSLQDLPELLELEGEMLRILTEGFATHRLLSLGLWATALLGHSSQAVALRREFVLGVVSELLRDDPQTMIGLWVSPLRGSRRVRRLQIVHSPFSLPQLLGMDLQQNTVNAVTVYKADLPA